MNFLKNITGPYIIAEIGVNHEGNLQKAKELIELAKEGGAHAAKFQSYKAETLASKHSPSYWDTTKEKTKSQYELFKKYDTFNESEYIDLAKHCKKVGIDFLSTPFDLKAVDFLDSYMPFYKIASADITNIPLIRKISSKNKPVVLSTGASTLGEIDMAINELNSCGVKEIALLHCVLNYPTPDENAYLDMITGLKRAYPNRVIGYSDHTLPDENMTSLVTAYLLGSMVLEKHFTHDKTLPGNDHYHAMDVHDLKKFNQILKKINVLRGLTEHKHPLQSEEIARQNARRSIVLARDISKGEVLKETDLICKRPGFGLSPLYWDKVIGKKVAIDLKDDHILQWKDLIDEDR